MNGLIPNEYTHNIEFDNATIIKLFAAVVLLMIISAIISKIIG